MAFPLVPLIISGASAIASGVGDWINRNTQATQNQAISNQIGISSTDLTNAYKGASTLLQDQFKAYQNVMNPYINAGTGALTQYQNLMGIGEGGAAAQEAAINNIANSPVLQELMAQGENAMLQNASATGGLRGGNIQGALAQYRPQMVNQQIQQQYANLGNLMNLGYGASGQLGTAGMGMGSQLAGMQTGLAQTLADMDIKKAGLVTVADPWASVMAGIGSGLGTYAGLGGDFGLSDAQKASLLGL